MTATSSFITIDIDRDAETLAEEAYDFIRTRWPEWEPADANLETWIIESLARLASEVAELTADVSLAILREFGETVAGVPPVDAVEATATTTWTMVDNMGYTIPAGTLVGIVGADDELIAFEVVSEVTVPNGSTSTAAGAVQLRAVEAGTNANDLTATPELIDALAFVSSIALVTGPSGGTDAESDEDYLDRLVEELQIMTPRPIIPEDFEVLAKRVSGVHRAKAIDGWNPADDTLNNERYIGIVAIDEAGADVSAGIKTEIDELLQELREVNFVVVVDSPDYTAIDVTVTATAYPTFDPAAVDAAVTDALEEYLSPANWGVPPHGETDDWVNDDEVRFLEVAEAINRVAGVHYIDSLTVEGGTSDVALTGVVPLTQPGTISVTVNAP